MTCAANTIDARVCSRCGAVESAHLAPERTCPPHRCVSVECARSHETASGNYSTFREVPPSPRPIFRAEFDAVTVEVGRLSHAQREVRRLVALPSSDLLIEWRRHCIAEKRFTAPDWETGEAGMLRALILGALAKAGAV